MKVVGKLIHSMAPVASVIKIPASQLHISKPTWWLESRFHFSFANWYGPGAKQSFGALRVFNDDLVKPKAGFGAHPHSNAEIFSYVVKGELSHQDSMGNKEALPAGGVQYLSAGTGIVHSEMNDGPSTCRFLQVWLMPDAKGHAPQYGSLLTTSEQRKNQLLAILKGTGEMPAWPSAVQVHQDAPVLHQDATVFVSEADPGLAQEAVLGAHRQAYLVCINGSMDVGSHDGDTRLETREAAEMVATGGKALHLTLTAGAEGAHFMLIEMAQRPRTSW